MIRNYVRTAVRGMLTHKLFSFINLFGLAIGLASVILIGLFVLDELSYDRYHDDARSLYRISRDFYPVNGSEEQLLATNDAPAADLLRADFPEIEAAARLWGGRVLLSREEVAFYEDAVQFVDPVFLDMFHFEWIAGDQATALNQPFNIVLTEATARKYFGNEDPLGKTLELENAVPLTVSGVIRDLPGSTHLQANALTSLELVFRKFGEQARASWNENVSYHTYVKLVPGASIQEMQKALPAFVDRHIGQNASQWTGMQAMAVTDIHLHSTRQGEMQPPGSMATVLALIAIAGGILVIACFNFMNLATALSALRSREVGVRKSVGARRGQLVAQFLREALGMTVLATLIAMVVVELLMPAFNAFTGRALVFDLWGDGALQAALLILVLVVGCGAGAWPALHLSALSPARVLKSRPEGTASGLAFRNILVVLQFSISIMLVIATAVVLLQARYARELDPGFTRDQVVILNGPPSQGVTRQWEALKAELLTHPEIVQVSASNFAPGQENPNSFTVRQAGAQENLDFPLPFLFVGYDFFETYGVPLLSGRVFSEEFPNDMVELPAVSFAPAGTDGAEAAASGGAESREINGNFILNASAIQDFGWSPEAAVGQELRVFRNGYTITGRAVGVVDDSHFESVRFSVKPMLFILVPPGIWADQRPTLNSASVRLSGRDLATTLDFIDRTWNTIHPDFPVMRSFLSDRMDALYQDDSRLGQLFSYFSLLAILIACLGLFGLATFNAQRRIKEIGVRKVMGGSVWSIVLLLTNDFSKLVLISNVMAWPIAYFAMNRWLENFAYRIDLTPLIFIGSGLIALCIAWVTVGGTAVKSASAKPVLALRYE